MHRRQFLSATGSAFAALLASGCGSRGNHKRLAAPAKGVASLIEDDNGLLDLLPGFSYRVLSSMGDLMSDGEPVPDKADGMGCFELNNGTIALVRNHEMNPDDKAGIQLTVGFGTSRGEVLSGGTTHIILDADTLAVQSQFRSLAGTVRNCAGGVTPWNSWLSCEEVHIGPDPRGGYNFSQPHGWVFEVPAHTDGLVAAEPLTAMGRFNHEAACVDPSSGFVYLTEDREDGVLYRFIPDSPQQLSAGGRLQAMQVVGAPDVRNWRRPRVEEGTSWPVKWLDLDNVESPDDDLRQRAVAKGATLLARGEGIHMGAGEAYICSTNGGAAKLGQVFRLVPASQGAPDRLQLFFEGQSVDELNFGDNLTVAPNGHLIICEDRHAEPINNHLVGLSPDGVSNNLGRLRLPTELAGACFSPDGRHLFVNVYSPTRTLAITGPWSQFFQV